MQTPITERVSEAKVVVHCTSPLSVFGNTQYKCECHRQQMPSPSKVNTEVPRIETDGLVNWSEVSKHFKHNIFYHH